MVFILLWIELNKMVAKFCIKFEYKSGEMCANRSINGDMDFLCDRIGTSYVNFTKYALPFYCKSQNSIHY